MIKIYTDGSANPNPGEGAWAVVIHNNNTKQSITGYEGYTTNNRMEIIAVIQAIKWCIDNNTDATIYCDSEYVVKGFNIWSNEWSAKGWKKPNKNKDLWKELHKLKYKFKGLLLWVRSHNGCEGNEEADLLAQTTRELGTNEN